MAMLEKTQCPECEMTRTDLAEAVRRFHIQRDRADFAEGEVRVMRKLLEAKDAEVQAVRKPLGPEEAEALAMQRLLDVKDEQIKVMQKLLDVKSEQIKSLRGELHDCRPASARVARQEAERAHVPNLTDCMYGNDQVNTAIDTKDGVVVVSTWRSTLTRAVNKWVYGVHRDGKIIESHVFKTPWERDAAAAEKIAKFSGDRHG